MTVGLIAEKIGMTQLFDDKGVNVPVTVLKVEPCTVVALKTEEKHGYNAVQLGGAGKPKNISKPLQGYFSKASEEGIEAKRVLKEFRIAEDEMSGFSVGSEIRVDHFANGQIVDVTGTSVGKGFAGAMKRHGFGGLRASHGVSVSHRSHGSTGNRQDPGKVFKNKKMAGHMGARRVTKLNLEIHSVDLENNLILIKGSVPGAKGGIVYVRSAIKAKKNNKA